MGWFFVALLIAQLALSVASALLNKPKKEKPTPFQPPEVEPGTPIPVLFGRGRIAGQVIWYGGYRTKSVKVSAGGIAGFFGAQVQVGTRYIVDMAMALCVGELTKLHDIVSETGKKLSQYGFTKVAEFEEGEFLPQFTISPASNPPLPQDTLHMFVNGDGSKEFELLAPNWYGGKHEEGGVFGTMHYYPGTTRQPPNAYMATKRGTEVPSWPHIAYVVFEDFTIGQSAYPKPIYFEVERRSWDSAWSHNDTTGDENPLGIIREIMTNSFWGLGLPRSALENQYGAAREWFSAEGQLGQYENFYVSGMLTSQDAAESTIDELLATIDGVIYRDPVSGLLLPKLIRNDYFVENLDLFDESNILECEYTQSGWRDTVNEVKVIFTDRSRDYQQNQVTAQNLASIQALGRVVPKTVEYLWVMNETLALRLAQRDLRALSAPLAKATLTLNREGFDLYEGAVFRFSWSDADVSEMVMRVKKVTKAGVSAGEIKVECVEDVFSLPDIAAYGTSTGGPWTDPSGPRNVTPPSVTQVPSQTDSVGKLGLQIDDPDDVVTLVEFRHQYGHDEWSDWITITSLPYTDSVPLHPDFPSAIQWRVTYTDGAGEDETIEGGWIFSVATTANTPSLSYTIDEDGLVTVTASAPGLDSVKFASDTTLPEADDVRAGVEDTSFPYTAVFGPLTDGQTIVVGAFGYDFAGNESRMASAVITRHVVPDPPGLPDDEAGANEFWGGPVSGADAVPVFRHLVQADIPAASIDSGKLTTAMLALDIGGQFGDAVNAPSPNVIAQGRVDFACTILTGDISADPSGSAIVEVYTSPDAVTWTKINASAPLTLSAAQHASDSTLTGWTKTFSAGTFVRFKLTSLSTVKLVSVTLKCQKTG